ncbi:MAG: hypothetical protein QM765_49185 [Myxococcales bacterium]
MPPLRPLLLALCVLAFPAAARADGYTNQPTLSVASGASASFGQSACRSGSGTAVTYSFDGGYSSGARLMVYATASSTCSDPDSLPDDAVVLMDETTLSSSNASDTLAITGKSLASTCPADTETEFLVCAVSTVATTSSTTGATSWEVAYKTSLTVRYDSAPPGRPVFATSAAGDSAIYLYWNTQDDVDEFRAYYRRVDADDAAAEESICPDTDAGTAATTSAATDESPPDAGSPPTSADAGPFVAATYDCSSAESGCYATFADGESGAGAVRGLTNGYRYEFVLVAVDEAGNASPASDPIVASPVTVQDFYRRYRCAGGTETGFGCAAGGQNPIWPIGAAAALVLLVRRRASDGRRLEQSVRSGVARTRQRTRRF